MPDDRCRLGSDDVVIGLDLASAEHQAVVLTAAGQRLTRFRIPHTRAGLVAQVRTHRAGHRIWRYKLTQIQREAAQTIACPDGLDVLAREVQRAGARLDRLAAHMTAVAAEIAVVLAELAEVPSP